MRQFRTRTGASADAVANAIAMRWSAALSTSPPDIAPPSITMPSAVARAGTPSVARGGGARRDTIAFLHPQLPGPGHAGNPAGARRGDEHGRKFVDRQRHQRGIDVDAAQLPAAHPQIRHRLASDGAGIRARDVRPIRSRMARIPARVGFIPTFRTSRSEPGRPAAAARKNAAEEMSPGTSISVAARTPSPLDADARSRTSGGDAERGEHPLGMVTRRRGLRHAGPPVRVEPREEDAGLHLRARTGLA